MTAQLEGIGMTSRRTRMRLVQRLREAGIESDRVLEIMGEVPRHIFLDEALSHRAYEDTSLPIGYGQTRQGAGPVASAERQECVPETR